MKFTISSLAVTIFLSVLAIASCKVADEFGSEVESIDAITSGDQSQRNKVMCGDNAEPNTTPAEAVQRVYRNVPVALQEIFGSSQFVSLEDDIVAACSEVLKDQAAQTRQAGDLRLDGIQGCWRLEEADDGRPIPHVKIAKSVQAVHGALLPMITYAVVELYVDRVWATALEDLRGESLDVEGRRIKRFVNAYMDNRDELARAMFADLEARYPETREVYRRDYGESYKDSTFLKNLFVAELVDTHYCSAASRATFTSAAFPRSYRVFANMVDLLNRSTYENL